MSCAYLYLKVLAFAEYVLLWDEGPLFVSLKLFSEVRQTVFLIL